MWLDYRNRKNLYVWNNGGEITPKTETTGMKALEIAENLLFIFKLPSSLWLLRRKG